MSDSQFTYFYNKQLEADKVEKVINKLNISEAFYYAYVGGQGDKEHKCIKVYNEWRTKNYNELLPEDKKIKPVSFWDVKDNLKKKSKKRSFKIV
jgi:hypothetical protein